MSTRPVALSLFSGAGGLDVGLIAAGYKLVASVEFEKDCCETLRKNGTGLVYEQAVESLKPADLLADTGLRVGEVDLLAGGPPCQPFSKLARWNSKSGMGFADQRADCIGSFMNFARAIKPKAILFENVEGLLHNGGLDVVMAQLAKLRDRHGKKYKSRWQLLNAADYGVPQQRRRLFLIAVESCASFDFPEPTHGTSSVRYVSAWDALRSPRRIYEEDLRIRGRWAKLVPSIPEGRNYLWHTERGGGVQLFGWRTRYWSFLYKLAKAAPSPTIVASPSQNSGPYHWENRLLSTGELAALQTFPKRYRFAGDRASRHRQIGNAVPPLLAEVLGRSLLSQCSSPPTGKPKLHVSLARHTPKPERRRPVPNSYKPLIGKYLPHPGTGRGPSPRTKPATEVMMLQS